MATTPAYEGVTGGKFRKRPFRRAAATPYDRPPAAARGLLVHPVEEVRNGWLSRLVDPASRIINRSASRFFSSIFRKRLGAPPEAPEAILESGKEISEVVSTNPLSATQEQGRKNKDHSKVNAESDGITEFEQLLKQKTFTRVEFDRLSELLRSRTIDMPVVNGKIETVPSVPQLPIKEKQENANVSAQENLMGSSKIFGSTSAPFSKVLGEEIASPTELARAYMGSRFSKVSPSTSGFQNQVPREVSTLPRVISFAPKPFDASIAPRSVVRFSGISRPSESGYLTPRPRGRSEIYKMSRSPYFKRAGVTGDAYAGPSTSSQWTPTDVTLSRGNQVLKRRISVLDSDLGSVGSMRRIRQKSNLVSPSKDTSMSRRGKSLSTLSTLSDFDSIKGSMSSSQKPMSDGTNYDASNQQDEGNREDKIAHGSLAHIPPKSTEMARKIFQHIDKVVPSPKEKSSELKAANDESSPKLTLKMLHARALRSVEDIDSSKIHNVTDNAKLGSSSATNSKRPISFASSKQGENGSSKTAIAEVKLTSEVNNFHRAAISLGDNMPAMRTAGFHFMNSTAVPPQQKPGFQMQALEDSVELDDFASRDSPGPTAIGKEKLEAANLEQKVITNETTLPNKLLVPSSDGEPASRSTVNKDAHSRGTDELVVAAKETGFTFPVVPSPSILPPPTPTIPIPLTVKAAPLKEQSFAPTFSFGSRNAPTLKFSSINSSFNNSEGLNFGAKSELKLEGLDSSTTVMTPTAPVEIPNFDKGDTTTLKAGDTFKSSVNAASLAMSVSTTPIYTFGSSSSLFNGLAAPSKPTISSVSAAPEQQLSNRSASSSITSNGVSSTSRSALPTTFPSQTLFQLGSSASSVSTSSVPSPVVESKSKPLESNPVKESPFSAASLSSVAPSSVFSSTSSEIFGFGASASSTATIGSTTGSLIGIQTTQPATCNSPFAQSMVSQFNSSASSPAFGLGGGTLAFTFGGSASGPSTSGAKYFGSSSGVGPSFSATSSIAGASSSIPTGSSSSPLSATALSIFNSSSQPTTQPVFGSSWGQGFSFASASGTTSSVSMSPAGPAFGTPTSTACFNSGSPANDQMSVEDSMTDAAPQVRGFGQPANAPAPTRFSFSSPAVTSGRDQVFQFSSQQQGSAFPQSPSPFQAAAGSLEVNVGGSFSFGSGGGGDKSGRRISKFRRGDKHRRK